MPCRFFKAMNDIAKFEVNDKLCIGCSRCIKVCPGHLLYLNEEYHCRRNIPDADHPCWRCQHCLAVCPRGAIRIFNRDPEDSRMPASKDDASYILDSLIMTRRSHRRFLSRTVDPDMIRFLIDILSHAPNHENRQTVQFALIDRPEQMADIQDCLNASEPDPFCGAPCLLVPHSPAGEKYAEYDQVVAASYFELLCASRDLGAVIIPFPEDAAAIREVLEIPPDHITSVMVGFGWPEIPYARGVQRHVGDTRIHHPKTEH